MMEDVIFVNSLTKNYGGTNVVNNVSLNVAKGDIYGIVGKNGAGKTTIMKMLLGLIPKSSGEISLFGKSDEESLQHNRGKIGAMIESPAFYPYLTASDNLNYYRLQMGIKDKSCVKSVLKTVGLENTENKEFKNFSLGMKQRLGLALALLGEPEVLILDEPINGLDPEGIIEIREILKNLNAEKGVTIFISSHILSELSLLANKFAFIENGSIIAQTDIDQIRNSAGNKTLLKTSDIERSCKIIRDKFPDARFEIEDENIVFTLGYESEIVAVLSTNGIVVNGISNVSVSLEDYYVKLLKEYKK